MAERSLTVLCLASYEKGQEFLRQCKRRGCRILLLTVRSLTDAPWPWESLDEFLVLDDFTEPDRVVEAVARLAWRERLDRVVPLDEYDVETAAGIREQLRIPGMGETTARRFRDKLAMRMRAEEQEILVPPFVRILNEAEIREYLARVPPPWLLKPRFAASAVGIQKLRTAAEAWDRLDELGDRRVSFLLERFIPGDVFHVDGVVWNRTVTFAVACRYAQPLLEVAHEGGLFSTRLMRRGSYEEALLLRLAADVIGALGLVRGVTHTEFIRGREDGRFYFLESAARVAGAHIAEVIEAATDVNLWREWADVEVADAQHPYRPPTPRRDYAGSVISLARQEHPDTTAYADPEIVWRLDKRHHAGLVVASPDLTRVEALLDSYRPRFLQDFFASLPAPDRPTS